jgi:DNA-directed RNA polymerase specialized sigma24 family protein
MQHRPFPFSRLVATIAGVSNEPVFAALLEHHRIATNACFDLVARRGPHLEGLDELADDEPAAPAHERPDAIVIAQETLELALQAALHRLPPRQHAALVMRDVLSLSARETATALGTSVAATNSALQRGRSGLRSWLTADRLEWAAR